MAGVVVFVDRGSAAQFFIAIFVALLFLAFDTFIRPYTDFRCNALKVLTSMAMLITLLCGFASKLDVRNEVISDFTLGWTLILANFIVLLLGLSLELFQRALAVYAGVRHGIAYVKHTETTLPVTGIVTNKGKYRKSGQDEISVAVKVFPLHKYAHAQLVHDKIQNMGTQPQISQVYGTEVEHGLLYVATMPVQSTLKKFHTCPIPATEFCTSLIQAVKMIHDQNIAIRNIKPESMSLVDGF